MSTPTGASAGAADLRQRRGDAPRDAEAEAAAEAVTEPPAGDAGKARDKKTYGRTPDGTVFVVPTTHDMVSQLLDPREPKNYSDALVLAVLALHMVAAWRLPAHLKKPVFALIYLFWRAAYNVGIGILLHVQSKHRLMVGWARRWRLFERPSTGRQPRPWLYRLLKEELEAKIPHDYRFEEAPLEYNAWLVFRRVVDLILMCDFVSYCLFALVCAHQPEGESLSLFAARWAVGVLLFGFNVWVKLDAHRVVKDYAWYWGDFFYLIDQELTFDGVFEMAPHPMYSIGYAGYYGISAMAASYEVLFISIAAHLAQMLFLVFVENPHIEKTYNPPPPRRARTGSAPPPGPALDGGDAAAPAAGGEPRSPVHSLLGLKSLDLFRSTDYSVLLLALYLGALTLVTPATPLCQALFFLHALLWRLWYSIGLGVILKLQSREKMVTRHFLKYGESADEAWRQWKAMYHLSTVMVHASFVAACWKMYTPPDNWAYGMVLLKHTAGLGLVALQVWTAASICDELGEFGWFFGDFFFAPPAKLSYRSIYRFLNNPERVIGLAGLWGAALITWSRAIFLLALAGQILTLGFIALVEKPHMEKVYGKRNMRGEAGLTKFLRRSLPPPVKEWQQSVDRVLDDTRHFVDDVVEAARPKFASGVSSIVRDTTALFNKYPARLTITRLSPDLAGLDPKQYSLSVSGTPSAATTSERATGKEAPTARVPKDVKTLAFEYGAPIRVRWTAPARHSRRDWVGLYMVTDNRSREVTEVSSLGRWVPTCPNVYDTATDRGVLASDRPLPPAGGGADAADAADGRVCGEMLFEGDKLWWTQGVFEFRYHHDGAHNVMSVSEPFEIRIARFGDDDADADAVEAALLPVVRNCLDRDPDLAPAAVDEPFGALVERDAKYAKRVVYAVQHMFGVEFAPGVVPADGDVRKLAWRIRHAKQVLAPYSMSRARGATTPTTDKFADDAR